MSHRRSVLAAALIATASAPALGQGMGLAGTNAPPPPARPIEQVVRVYSIAGLADLIEPPPPPANDDLPPNSAVSTFASEPKATKPQTPFDLAQGLAKAVDIELIPLGPSMVAVRTTTDRHDAFASILEQIRRATSERFRVELTIVSAEGAPPAVGSTIELPANPEARLQRVIPQLLMADFSAQRFQGYIAEIQPIVGSSSVGYELEAEFIPTGLVARLRLGYLNGQSIELRVNAAYERSTLQDLQLPLGTDGKELPLGLPTIERRSLDSTIAIPLGQTTIISTAPGFEPRSTLLLVARIDKLE